MTAPEDAMQALRHFDDGGKHLYLTAAAEIWAD